MAEYILYLWIGAIGLVIGSFLNVLVYRIPRNISFGLSRSICPACKNPIKFYDNIPIISFIILLGKCRNCGAKISIRYPVVELLNCIGYLFLFYEFGVTYTFIAYSFLTSILIAIFLIDIDFQIIPDILTIPGVIAGLGISFVPNGIGIVSSIIGLLAGGGGVYLVAIMGDWLFKKESMGGGDIKMAAMLGAFLGWQKVILIFIGGAFIGMIISIFLMIISKKIRATRVIPFGPFLAIAAIIAIIYGDEIISFYLRYFLRS
jgi:leader peptidase (prepilin peptidase)/N-methyltransferase